MTSVRLLFPVVPPVGLNEVLILAFTRRFSSTRAIWRRSARDSLSTARTRPARRGRLVTRASRFTLAAEAWPRGRLARMPTRSKPGPGTRTTTTTRPFL